MAQKPAVTISSQAYNWKNVPIVGGGFVDGFVFHPKARHIRYCRTDMGGAYRWENQSGRWQSLLDFISYEDRNLMGVESIALDPNDSNFLLLACGTYTNERTGPGAILRSTDKGKTFQRVNVPLKFGGNENGRGNGERMMIDPRNSNIIYLGTRHNGLWSSKDRGLSWQPVSSFPEVTERINVPRDMDSTQQRRFLAQNRGSGVVMCLFDQRNTGRPFSIVYVLVSLINRQHFFKSVDGGTTWQPVQGQPTLYRPTHALLARDGMMYITYGDNPGPSPMANGAVWTYNTTTGEWRDITPDKPSVGKREFGYAAVAVDAQQQQTIMVTTFDRYQEGGEEIFRSPDGGTTWTTVFPHSRFDHSFAPYVARTGVHWMFDIEIDPFDPDHALFTTGYGGHETFNLTAIDKGGEVIWKLMSPGIEETVALDLLSPPAGAHVITAIGDYGGFVHEYLDKPGIHFTNPHFGNTDGLASAAMNASLIVRVGVASEGLKNQNIGYSTDGGRTWQPTGNMPSPNSAHGHISVSADGRHWIWTPRRSPAYVTHDRGNTWQPSKGITPNLRVISDAVNPEKFYALSLPEGLLLTSIDGGNHFTAHRLDPVVRIPQKGILRGDVRGGQDRIYATPAMEGHLWIAAFDGLYHSSNGGSTFIPIKRVTEIHGFGFGKDAPGAGYPSLYLIGVIDGIRGIFRSDDKAGNWVRINDEQHQWGLLLHITGDPKQWGRVYVGTHGRGIIHGAPKK